MRRWTLGVALVTGMTALLAAGDSMAQNANNGGPKVKLPDVPKPIVEAAKKWPNIEYGRSRKGGGYTNGAWSGGWQIALGIAAYNGDASADDRLLEQIRSSLKGTNALCGNGGYPTQHERHITGTYALAKLTPRLWAKLSAEEQHKVDLLMKAALVGSAYTTSDASNEGRKPTTLDADTNLNRGWNPNFREGMIGAMVVGTVYFGGGAGAHKVLDSYNHEAFVKELKDAGLTNTVEIFTWKEKHPDSDAPDGKTLEQMVKNYRYLGKDLSDPFEIYYGLTVNTYGGKVNAGLNNGEGVQGAGKIAKGADKLPNVGKDGMLLEFMSRDANGPRSAMGYCYDGFRTNLTNHVVLVAGGYWKKGEKAKEILDRMDVGITDLFYKLENGYIDYSKGKGSKDVFDLTRKSFPFEVNRAVWEVMKGYHKAQGEMK